jgi:adenylate kinase family enzyme
MINRIHILSASGSGTTTLGKALSSKLGFRHFDTDNYFWLPTDPPFQEKRDIQERQELLKQDLDTKHDWILTGSLCGWGDIFIPMFDLVVYLWIPMEIRINRLMEREAKRYGQEAVGVGGKMYETSKAFIEWASQYDTGGMEIRSRVLHEKWLDGLKCPVLRQEGDLTVEERVEAIVDRIKK